MKTMTRWMVLATALLLVSPALAVDPPGLVNYQGVLRDDTDKPLDGSYDMVFRFYDDADPADPENEIFIDEHLVSGTGAVTVTGGLFDVVLGSGDFRDGSGPGDHPHIYYVFGLHESVYLQVQIGADGDPDVEILQPRMQVVSAPYAIHAAVLGGYAPSDFINTTSEEQEKDGLLRVLGGIDLGHGTDDDLTWLDVQTLTGGSSVQADPLHTHNWVNNADTVDGYHGALLLNATSAPQEKTGLLRLMGGADFGDGVDDDLSAADVTTLTAGSSADGLHTHDSVADADTVDGKHAGDFIDTSSTPQSKFGPLVVHAAGAGPAGIEAVGDTTGGFFASGGSGYAFVGYLNDGIQAHGADYGVWAEGGTAGGRFRDTTAAEGALAYVGYGNLGIEARGKGAGGYFKDNDDSGYAWVGYVDEGISAHGDLQGGYFEDNDLTSNAHIAYGNRGIEAYGQHAGGYFEDLDDGGMAYVGYGGKGIYAEGDQVGGQFYNAYGGVTRGSALVAFREPVLGTSYGVHAAGEDIGGHFATYSGSGNVDLGVGDRGIHSEGEYSGGYFYNTSGAAWAEVAYNEPGTGYLHGIAAGGAWAGGRFFAVGASGDAYVGFHDVGVFASGNEAGGHFTDLTTSVWAAVGAGSTKITGTGGVSFIQNHPYDPEQVVVYTAPEGDEVATYTRGTGRLENGEARVALGETFAWVTNPDIGLTVHVTPRGEEPLPIAVASVSTEELVVRGPVGSDAAFDFLVYGLRIGFEEKAVVRAKERESYIPSMADHRALYEQQPELRAFNALARFKQMHTAVYGTHAEDVDTSASQALREAIHEYDPATDPPVQELFGYGPLQDGEMPESHASSSTAIEEAVEEVVRVAGPAGSREGDPATRPDGDEMFPVGESVEAGDLLALDPERPGVLVRAATAQDPGVVGIAKGQAVAVEGELRVTLETDFALLNVDAGYGEIRAGDLLTTSFTPGHAMRAIESLPGTIVGKALEPLETGTGRIRVLVMLR